MSSTPGGVQAETDQTSRDAMEDATPALDGRLDLGMPEVPPQLQDPPYSGLGSSPTLRSMYFPWALGPTASCLTGGDEGQERCQGVLFMQTRMGMNGLIMSHVLNQKHDSKDSGSLCMGSFSSSWWCPLCRTVYLSEACSVQTRPLLGAQDRPSKPHEASCLGCSSDGM